MVYLLTALRGKEDIGASGGVKLIKSFGGKWHCPDAYFEKAGHVCTKQSLQISAAADIETFQKITTAINAPECSIGNYQALQEISITLQIPKV